MARKKFLAKIDRKSELVGLGRITNKGEWIGRNSRFKEGFILNGNESEGASAFTILFGYSIWILISGYSTW